MKPEERIRRRVGILLDCANLMEVSRRTGIPRTTLRNWQQEPLRIKALDLEKLEDLLGKGKERYKSQHAKTSGRRNERSSRRLEE